MENNCLVSESLSIIGGLPRAPMALRADCLLDQNLNIEVGAISPSENSQFAYDKRHL